MPISNIKIASEAKITTTFGAQRFVMPSGYLGFIKGEKGEQGEGSATVTIGTVTTVSYGSGATVTNSGTPTAAILDFELPSGPSGPAGPAGADGTDGADGASILNGTVDPTTEGVNGDFYINTTSKEIFGPKTGGSWGAGTSLIGPQGATGAAGADGTNGLGWTGGSYNSSTGIITFTSTDGLGFSTSDLRGAATVTIGTVTTGAAGSSATVTNSGTATAAILDFSIPQGNNGLGVPAGGTTGQVLRKVSATDNDTEWGTVSVSPGGSTTQLQFNSSGSFGGATHVTYNSATGETSFAKKITIAATTDSATGVINSGSSSFIHTYGTNNLFIGGSSGNFTMTGTSNTAIGAFTLTSLTSGLANVAIGTQALRNVTTGQNNMGIGTYALYAVTTGRFNVAIGPNTLRFANSTYYGCAIGYQALYNATGNNNMGFGYTAGWDITTGTNNIVFGKDAGKGIVTGSGNVIIGSITGLSASLSNTIKIGTGGGIERLTIDADGHTTFEGLVKPKTYTVATLPTASTVTGYRGMVSDSTVAGSGNFGAVVAGGGANVVPVYSDGTNWRIG